jgi:hypothetical protein
MAIFPDGSYRLLDGFIEKWRKAAHWNFTYPFGLSSWKGQARTEQLVCLFLFISWKLDPKFLCYKSQRKYRYLEKSSF